MAFLITVPTALAIFFAIFILVCVESVFKKLLRLFSLVPGAPSSVPELSWEPARGRSRRSRWARPPLRGICPPALVVQEELRPGMESAQGQAEGGERPGPCAHFVTPPPFCAHVVMESSWPCMFVWAIQSRFQARLTAKHSRFWGPGVARAVCASSVVPASRTVGGRASLSCSVQLETSDTPH